jgi:hypothetical protein
MTQVTITIPDDVKDRVLDGFSYSRGYEDTISNPGYDSDNPRSPLTIPNPESKLEFVKRTLIQILTESVMSYESREAASDAAEAAQADVNSKVNLT